MMMRSEAEIRKQVEARVRRWGLLALNGILWVGAAKLIYGYSQNYSFIGSQSDVIVVVMVGWVIAVGLHFLRTVYVELREWLVQRAIQRERQRYAQDDAYEKHKHDESPLLMSDDGELTGLPVWNDEDEYAQRSRNS